MMLSYLCLFILWPAGFTHAFAPQSGQTLKIHAKPISRNDDLASFPLQAASPIIMTAIDKTEEITAIEALFPFVNRFLVSPDEVKKMITSVTGHYSVLGRIASFAIAGYIVPYIGQICRGILSRGKLGSLLRIKSISPNSEEYKRTKTYHVFNHARQGFFLGAANNLVDFVLDNFIACDTNTKLVVAISNAFTSGCFTIWAMYRMKLYKDIVINLIMKKKKKSERYIKVWKETTNYCLYLLTAVVISNLIGIKYSFAFKTLSAFGGIGTLVFGLACNDIASEVVSGLLLAAQRPFDEGDYILYGDDQSKGKVEKVGTMYTLIKDADQLQVKIPNSQLNAQPISNLTRNKVSRIKQKVRFTYDGLDKMPELIDTIKSEIKSSCPKLITNSRSRVYFNSFEVGYLEVVVNMKFNIRPRGSEYYACKNEVMYAIARAAKKCNVEFQTELE